MKRPVISVIVPVYNAEKYLRKCLRSIQDQTFNELEVVCVNDGSTDGSLGIMKEFAKNDKRFRIINQDNRGINGARATGYEAANGLYVAYVDSDDFLNRNAYECMMTEINNYDCDIVICNYSFFPEKIKNKDLWYRPFKGDNDWRFIARNTVPWNKIMKKSFLDKLDICNMFLEMGENVYSIILASTKKIATIDDPLYNYRVGHVSLSTNYSDVAWFEQVVKDNKRKYECAEERGLREDTRQYFFYCYLYYNLVLMSVAAKNGRKKKYLGAKNIVKKDALFSGKYEIFLRDNLSFLKRVFFRDFVYRNYLLAKITTKILLR